MKKSGKQMAKIQKMRGDKPYSPPPRPTRPTPKDYGEKPQRKPPKPTPPPPKDK